MGERRQRFDAAGPTRNEAASSGMAAVERSAARRAPPVATTRWEPRTREGWRPFFFFQAEDGIRDVAVTGQTCALPILLDGDEVLYIRVLESPHTFRLAAHAGIRSPLHSTALGKALLGTLPDSELQKAVRRCDFR